MPIKIVIADDHPLVLKGLNDFLIENGFEIAAKAKNGKEAFDKIKAYQPEIAILDIQMPYLSGLEVARKCFEQNLLTKVIIITFEKTEKIYNEAIAIDNIHGYILKEFAIEEIKDCIETVMSGLSYFSPELLKFIDKKKIPEELKLLTQTEIKVLKLVLENKTAKEISQVLFSSDRTIEKHKSNIRSKLKLSSKRQSMVIFAKEYEDYLLKYT
ncbi:MAG: response regulator transcription factor [Bacteroidota bacterium]